MRSRWEQFYMQNFISFKSSLNLEDKKFRINFFPARHEPSPKRLLIASHSNSNEEPIKNTSRKCLNWHTLDVGLISTALEGKGMEMSLPCMILVGIMKSTEKAVKGAQKGSQFFDMLKITFWEFEIMLKKEIEKVKVNEVEGSGWVWKCGEMFDVSIEHLMVDLWDENIYWKFDRRIWSIWIWYRWKFSHFILIFNFFLLTFEFPLFSLVWR